MVQDAELISMYVDQGSEDAFSELVHRYLPLVHSAALRQTNGNRDLAKDIAQDVFLDLARKAGRLPHGHSLAGWLYVGTRLASLKALRGIERRRVRERVAFEMQTHEVATTDMPSDLAHVLDDALDELDSEHREALLLRYFQGKELKDVGAALSISEDAARMRISRSLSRLHSILTGRGVCLSCESLATTLAAEAATAIPAGLASHITCMALSSVPLAAGTSVSFLQLLTSSKLHAGIAAVLIAAGVGMPFVVHYQARSRLAEAQRQLAARSSELSIAVAENEHLQSQLQESRASIAKGPELGELLRLRGEVTRLRKQIREAPGGDAVALALRQSPASVTAPLTPAPVERTNVVIQFVGPKLVDEEVVRTNISRMADTADTASGKEAIDRDIRNIFATGYFNDVKVVERTNDAGKSLVYLVKCRPQVLSISFAGNTIFTERELIERISSQPGAPLDERLLLADRETIERSYKETGHSRATVKTVQKVDEPTGSSAVVFEILENL